LFVCNDYEEHFAHALEPELRKRARNGAIVVKTIKNASPQQQINLESFYRELSVMFRFVGKPNIVQLVGFCNDPNAILTDYYALGNLESAIASRNSIISSKQVIVSFGSQLSDALAQLHESGYAHCSLRPANVMIDMNEKGDLQCYLGDFSLVESSTANGSGVIMKNNQTTNMARYARNYTAPEVMQRIRMTIQTKMAIMWQYDEFRRADLYSLGLILQELVNWTSAWSREVWKQ
jgi:serine/threonine protein kinase